MKFLTLALAGTLMTAAGLSATAAIARPGTLGEAGRGSPRVGSFPPGSLGEGRMRSRFRASQLSPHIGLPGFSGFGDPQISPHIGLPGFSGFGQPQSEFDRHGRHGHGHGHGDDQVVDGYWGYSGDGDGYVDTIPEADQFGFFATGGEVTMEPDGPVYHYDRSYPYDWYRGTARPAGATPRPYGASVQTGLHCRIHTVRDEAQGEAVPVRVCAPS